MTVSPERTEEGEELLVSSSCVGVVVPELRASAIVKLPSLSVGVRVATVLSSCVWRPDGENSGAAVAVRPWMYEGGEGDGKTVGLSD